MKTKSKILVVCMSIALLAASCEKEERYGTNQPNQSIDSSREYICLNYSIDGSQLCYYQCTDEEYKALLCQLLAVTREGHRVTLKVTNASHRESLKDKQVREFDNEKDAIEWMNMMADKGYTVVSEYDEKTGIYTIIAII